MGTIGDLLGNELSSLFGDKQDDSTLLDEQIVTDTHLKDGCDGEGEAPPHPSDPIRSVVMSALTEEMCLPADCLKDSSTLKGDCDLDVLALYSVVTAVEHELNILLPDAQIVKLQTFGELCDLTSSFYQRRDL